MRRIYVLVEGLTEREFVTRILVPYFGKHGVPISAIPMLRSGGGMGFSNFDHFKNNVEKLLYETDLPVVTTFVDLFRFPVQSGDAHEEAELKRVSAEPNIDARIVGLENILANAVHKIKPYPNFLPYIQKHEFEALLFSDANVFEFEHVSIKHDVEALIEQIPNPEDINSTPEGHPAKRLNAIFSRHHRKYKKGADAVDFAELAGIETILGRCPRFKVWIENLLSRANAE